MAYYFINSNSSVNPISENQCIGDSLETINNNYLLLDNAAWSLSGAYLNLKQNYNTLIQSITSIGSPGTNYNSLSSTFSPLSSLIIP